MQRSAYKTRQLDLLMTYLESTQGQHFTADDVRKHFEEEKINIGVATIYRQLEKLVADGTLQKYFIDDHSAACFEYSGKDCAHCKPHFHLKCEVCGNLFHIECEELDQLIAHLSEKHDFDLNTVRTVLYGKCKKCRNLN
ncbi:Fur family transcriptional regulator [Treponema sp.]|uniref:Fur family transcriptional regulator n=1 Tax=Treponema sp. TaxID=166 RepID=UPI0025EB2313|nr:transcriptional repressor [Treponema sp.]MCR5219047.1 transcriptional repressor [Treponema sp.]